MGHNGHNGKLPPSVRLTHLWPVADQVEALKRQQPERTKYTERQLNLWRSMIVFSFRAAEWYGGRSAMMDAITSGEESAGFNAPWGLACEFPDIGAGNNPILEIYFGHALAAWIDAAIEQGHSREELWTPEAMDLALDFAREALQSPPETATKVDRCLDGTVTTITYYADGRTTWDSVLPDGTHKPHETRWRWDR